MEIVWGHLKKEIELADGELTAARIQLDILPMNIALTKHFNELIARLVSSGRYHDSSEVVRAGLRILEAEEEAIASVSLPPGSLRHLYAKADNQAERRTAKASTLRVEAA